MPKQIESIGEFCSLLDYYISCIEKEDMFSLKFNFKLDGKKFHSGIFKEEEFFLRKKEQVKVKKSRELENVFKNYKLLQRNMPVFYGYPLFMDANGNISPIFFVEIFFDERDDSMIFTKESVNPELNHYILTHHGFGVEEINKTRSEIDEEDNFIIKLERITDLLDLDKKTLSPFLEHSPLLYKQSPQLINKAILYFGERIGFTKGLLHDLRKLKDVPFDRLKSTSLGILVGDELPHGSGNKKELLEIFQLNMSQEKSVESAFSDNLSVITGPPGTGKSQVVLNVIANAVWNDKTVLFASKNNRAVDVVIEKLKSILSEDLIVRMGSGRHRKNAKSQIRTLFLNKDELKIYDSFEKDKLELRRINKRDNDVKELLNLMSKLNEQIDELQNQIDTSAKKIPQKLYYSCKNDSFKAISKFKLECEIRNTFENFGLVKKILMNVFPSIFRKKERNLFNEYYNQLSAPFKNYLERNVKLETEDIRRFLEWILLFRRCELLKEEIDSIKEELSKCPSIYDLRSKIEDIQNERIKLSRNLFENYWLRKIRKTSPADENHVFRYLDASEKLESYTEDYTLWKQLVSEQKNEIPEILSFLPTWVVTNLSAKNSLPLKDNLFDLLIIDEASQCDIASALPLFYRAKQAVIIGDPKQLKHISLLKEAEDKRIASEKQVSKLFLDYSYSENSLYDLAERVIKSKNKVPILLNQHYRSHIDIITFSNEYFYEKKLKIMTKEDKLIPAKDYQSGIKWIDIRGKTSQTKSPYNKEEANEIIKILREFKKSNLKNISFGIVTLFRAQMELIADLVGKSKELKDMDIAVGTTHRFQGDEKDIIIFSPAISEGVRGATLRWVNTTNQLLNVAVTRARSVLIVVGDKKKCYGTGGILKSLVEYADTKRDHSFNFDSPVEGELYRRLIKENIKVFPQYWVKVKGTKPYRLDFALFLNNNKYDIEVDGDKAHSQKTDSDVLRDIHLRIDDWKIRRFQASEVQNDIRGVVEEIKRLC